MNNVHRLENSSQKTVRSEAGMVKLRITNTYITRRRNARHLFKTTPGNFSKPEAKKE